MKSSFGVKGLSEQLAYLGSQGVAGGALQDQSQHFRLCGHVASYGYSDTAAQCSHGQNIKDLAWLWPLPLPYIMCAGPHQPARFRGRQGLPRSSCSRWEPMGDTEWRGYWTKQAAPTHPLGRQEGPSLHDTMCISIKLKTNKQQKV